MFAYKKIRLDIPTRFDVFIGNRDHLELEKADTEGRLDDIKGWLEDKSASEQDRALRLEFLNWHIKMTEPVFGQWNWTKAKK